MGRRLADLFHGRPRLQSGRCSPARSAGSSSATSARSRSSWSPRSGVNALSGELSGLHARQLPDPGRRARLPDDRPADDRDRRPGDAHRRAARVPDRLLHGEGREHPDEVGLVVAILMPLWSSYLVKVYAWRTILSTGGSSTGSSAPWAPRPRLRDRRWYGW